MTQLRIEPPFETGPQWLKNIIDENALNLWWNSLDYESKWAIACFLASSKLGGRIKVKEVDSS